MKGQTDAACDIAGAILRTGVPLLVPAHQVGGNAEFFAVDILAWLGDIEVLPEEFDWIHVELGGQIIQRAHGQDRCLGVVGCAPGARRSYIVANRGVLFPLMGNCENVRNGWHAPAAGTTRSPRFRLPGDQSAVPFRAHLHARVRGRPSARDFKFGIALQHDAHRFTLRLLRYLGSENSPAIRRELTAETAANVVLMNVNVAGRNCKRFRHLSGDAGNVLGGDVSE